MRTNIQRTIMVTVCTALVATLLCCSARSDTRRGPDPVTAKPIVLEYWVDDMGMGSATWGGRLDSQGPRMPLEDFLSAVTTPTEGEIGAGIMAITDGIATEIMVTPVGSWEVSDRPSPSLDLLIHWDTLHNAAADTYTGNPAPTLRYPDLVLDRWPHSQEMIAQGIYEPIGTLFRATAPDVTRAYPENVWTANTVNGKVCSFPVHTSARIRYWAIRKDLREDAGVDPVTTYRDLLLFAEAMKHSGQPSKLLLVEESGNLFSSIMRYYGIHPALWDNRSRDSYVSYLLYSRGNDPTIRVLADTTDREVLEAFDI